MRISVIGSGYVGLVSAVGWASLGHDVTCIDIDQEKLEKIGKGIPPIHEEGLEERLQKALSEGKIKTDPSFSKVPDSDIILVSVGTPSNADHSMDDQYIRSASRSIGEALKKSEKFNVVAVRSTVLPGTTERTVGGIIGQHSGKEPGAGFGLSMIPEFLREGTAIKDFHNPDRIIIGAQDSRSKEILRELHKPFDCPVVFTDIATAEMIKYASNAFLATKISYANEMAQICEKIGVDVDEVMAAVGMDKRIGPHFLNPGAGFGGSCLPKDVKVLGKKAKELGIEPKILEAAIDANEAHKMHILDMINERIGIKGKTIALLGLAFKPNSDDIRESPALSVARGLLDGGARIRAYDPHAMEKMKGIFPDVQYASNVEDCINGCDAAILLEAWPQFRIAAREYKEMLGDNPLFDARRIFSGDEAKEANLKYYCIGRGKP